MKNDIDKRPEDRLLCGHRRDAIKELYSRTASDANRERWIKYLEEVRAARLAGVVPGRTS